MTEQQRKAWRRLIASRLTKSGASLAGPVKTKRRPKNSDDRQELLRAVTKR